ncbi:MAG: UpxY family transcription antiterminator [Clostridium sp.]|nr:UpxY family transcription antiterminator [Bacteroides sp.]MCM1198943.1 UpxY family transcription antiterminator [Clostridium sp.]
MSALDDAGIRYFLPMKDIVTDAGGRKVRVKVPVISNLIFVHSSPAALAPIMSENSKFQFIFKRGGRENEPLIVPEKEMDDFIKAVENSSSPLYFSPGELNVSAGTRIRIIGGVFDGIEGIFLKVKGARSRRLVLEVPGMLAVAVEIEPEFVQVLA